MIERSIDQSLEDIEAIIAGNPGATAEQLSEFAKILELLGGHFQKVLQPFPIVAKIFKEEHKLCTKLLRLRQHEEVRLSCPMGSRRSYNLTIKQCSNFSSPFNVRQAGPLQNLNI